MTNFDALIPTAKSFYTRLAADNTKAWWADHKAEYDTTLKAPAKALIDDIADRLEKLHDEPFKGKLFRPHRDVRFSKDKTPYNTHLHMLWSQSDVADGGPGWFLGLSPHYVRIGWGWMGFTPKQIATWRDAVALTKIPDMIDGLGLILSDPELKRIPAGFDKDHPRGDFLRRKSLALWQDGSETGLVDQMMAHFETVKPVHKELTPLLT